MAAPTPASTARGRAFLRTICETPGDDTPRLVYADWLEEDGWAEQAEFIRLQIRLGPVDVTGRLSRDQRRQARRVEALLRDHAADFLQPLTLLAVRRALLTPPEDRLVWTFARGFVDTITVHGSTLERHAAAIFSHQPVTRVRLESARPRPLRAPELFDDALTSRGPATLRVPGPVFPFLGRVGFGCTIRGSVARFDPPAPCEEVISRAAVGYGRSRAGLTPLAWPAPSPDDFEGVE
jgi:uncharacterized protein (TIGR02996 family)